MKIDKNETLYELLSGMDYEEVEKENGLEQIQTFLKEGKNVSLNKIENPPYSDLQTPLDVAANYIGSTKLVKMLIENGAKFAKGIQEKEKERKWNETINQQLYDPIKNNDIAEVERLIKKGLDKDDQKCTPLLMAAETGNVEIMSLLVKTNLFTDAEHQTVVRTALEKNNIKILEYFASFDDELDIDEFYWNAIDSQNIQILEYCLNIPYAPYKNKMRKNLPFILCNAIEYEYIEVIKFLLKNNADPNKQPDDEKYKTPLTEANKTQNKEIIKLLVDAGAKL